MPNRRLEEKIFIWLMVVSLTVVLISLTAIIVVVVVQGAPALSVEMLTRTPHGGYYLGHGGGIANAIVGSLFLAGGGMIVALLFSLPIAFALQREYTRPALGHFTRLVLDVLWGIPSIVYGAFGFMVMLTGGLHASLLGGIFTLALLMLPIMVRSMDEAIRLVPRELKETAYAIGTTRIETALAVVLRQALPGILTGVILAFGRGIGDAASILFTAGYSDSIPSSLLDPAASLPLAVFFQLATPVPQVQRRAFAAALVLLVLVLMISLLARLVGRRWGRYRLK